MKAPSIAVIVPMFSDSSRYVTRLPLMRRLWIGLRTQTDQDFEVVAVDNCSYDDTKKLFLEQFSQGSSARWVLTTHGTPNHRSGARNRGARLASASHLIFLDCDLIPYPNLIANYRTFMRVHPDAVGQGFYYPYWDIVHLGEEFIVDSPAGRQIDYADLEKTVTLGQASLSDGRRISLAVRNAPFYACRLHAGRELFSGNFCIPKDLHLELGGFDEDFTDYGHEDTMLGMVLLKNKVEKYLVDNACCIHQNHRLSEDLSWKNDDVGAKKNRALLDSKLEQIGMSLT